MSEHTVVDLAGGLRGVVRRPPQPDANRGIHPRHSMYAGHTGRQSTWALSGR